MSNQQDSNTVDNSQSVKINAPSIHNIKCPKCGKSDFKILGTKGSKAAMGAGMALGAIGNIVANSVNKDDFTYKPIRYKCNDCKNKFEALPLQAESDEILDEPCTINFTRLSAFTGMAVAQNVWLNGIKVGSIGNGKSASFQTYTKYNTIFVTDQYGKAFKGDYKFVAKSGGSEDVRFKRKFK